MSKECSICHADKDLEIDFYKDKSCAGGYSTVCKKCRSRYKNKSFNDRDLINDAELVVELCGECLC